MMTSSKLSMPGDNTAEKYQRVSQDRTVHQRQPVDPRKVTPWPAQECFSYITSQTSLVPTSVIVSILQQKYWGGRGVEKFGEGEHEGREGVGEKERENYNQQQNPEQKPTAHSSRPRRPERERRARLHYITEPPLILASNLELLPKTCPSSSHQRLQWTGESQN